MFAFPHLLSLHYKQNKAVAPRVAAKRFGRRCCVALVFQGVTWAHPLAADPAAIQDQYASVVAGLLEHGMDVVLVNQGQLLNPHALLRDALAAFAETCGADLVCCVVPHTNAPSLHVMDAMGSNVLYYAHVSGFARVVRGAWPNAADEAANERVLAALTKTDKVALVSDYFDDDALSELLAEAIRANQALTAANEAEQRPLCQALARSLAEAFLPALQNAPAWSASPAIMRAPTYTPAMPRGRVDKQALTAPLRRQWLHVVQTIQNGANRPLRRPPAAALKEVPLSAFNRNWAFDGNVRGWVAREAPGTENANGFLHFILTPAPVAVAGAQ